MQKKHKIPVILYESEEQALPYIEVDKDDDMPSVLFIQEYKHTDETEPDSLGDEQPIVDIMVHMYANMSFLAKKLSSELYDEVRIAVGLQSLNKAREEGKKLLNNLCKTASTDSASPKEVEKINQSLTDKFYSTQKENDGKVKLQFEIIADDKEGK